MIPSTILRLSLLSVAAFLLVYVMFMMGSPIPIGRFTLFLASPLELPNHIVDCKEHHLPKRLTRFYQQQIQDRQYWLKKVLKEAENNSSFMYLYNNLVPEISCPESVRVGSTNDGGKWMCSPWRLPEDCTILSLGLRDEISFERQLQNVTHSRCKIYGFDMNQPSNETIRQFSQMNSVAEKAKISDVSNAEKNETTLEDLMSKNGISQIEILKMDIEGTEHQVLILFLEKFPAAQILIEIHGSAQNMLKLVSLMSKLGYYLLSYEINGKYHNLCEFSFVHETAFRRYGVKIMARFLNFEL